MPLADYIPQSWVNALTAINAARLNHIELGIDSANEAIRVLEAAPTGSGDVGSGGYLLKGDSAILANTTSQAISTTYVVPAGDLDIRIMLLDDGGLSGFAYYLTNITANSDTNVTSFTVNLLGGEPDDNIEFRWFIGSVVPGDLLGSVDSDGYLVVSEMTSSPGGSLYAYDEGVNDTNAAAVNATNLNAAAVKARAENKKLILPGGLINFSSQVVFDDIVVEGQGVLNTRLVCTSSLGAGVPAIRMLETAGTPWTCTLRDLNVEGPAAPSLGVKTANCDGVKLENSIRLENVYISRFDSGIVDASPFGHTSLIGVHSKGNYYGVYYAEAGSDDRFIVDSNIDNNSFANFAIPENRMLTNMYMLRTHCGAAPYGIYQEAGGSANGFMSSCVLDNVIFESMGNAAIFTEKYAARGDFFDNEVYHPRHYWSISDGWKIPSRNKNYACVVGVTSGSNVYEAGYQGFQRGDLGGWYVHANTAAWRVDLSNANFPTPNFNFVVNDSGYLQGFAWTPQFSVSFKGSDNIASGTSSRVVTVGVYAGPVEGLRPRIIPRGANWTQVPSISAISSNATTNSTSFTVSIPSNAAATMNFDWSFF